MVRNNYDDALSTLNFLVRQVQLLQYQVMLNQTPFGEFRPEVPIARRMYRADAFAELRKTQDWLEMRGLNKAGTIAHEAATFLLKPEQYAAVLLLRHIVMEGDCYWAGRVDESDPKDWVLMFARGNPDSPSDIRFCQQFPALLWVGKINDMGDVIDQPLKLFWKADAGTIEGWNLEPRNRKRIVEQKRKELMESLNVQPA